MKESIVLQQLEQIAEQTDLKVCPANLRKYSYSIQSGLCKVGGEYRVIIDKHLHLSEKIDVLIDALQNFSMDLSAVDPQIKKMLEKKNDGEHVFLGQSL